MSQNDKRFIRNLKFSISFIEDSSQQKFPYIQQKKL
jgi:hypothetical protein